MAGVRAGGTMYKMPFLLSECSRLAACLRWMRKEGKREEGQWLCERVLQVIPKVSPRTRLEEEYPGAEAKAEQRLTGAHMQ